MRECCVDSRFAGKFSIDQAFPFRCYSHLRGKRTPRSTSSQTWVKGKSIQRRDHAIHSAAHSGVRSSVSRDDRQWIECFVSSLRAGAFSRSLSRQVATKHQRDGAPQHAHRYAGHSATATSRWNRFSWPSNISPSTRASAAAPQRRPSHGRGHPARRSTL